jgi:hypothetical membrane protein
LTPNRAVGYPRGASRFRTLDRWLAAGAIVGSVLFTVTYTFAGALRPGYSPIDQAISDLGVGDRAWLLNVALIVLGLLLVGLAVDFYRLVRPEASRLLRLATAIFLAMVGAGYVVAGIFPETIPIHWLLGATLIYVGAPLGFLLAAVLLLRGGPTWRRLGVYSLVASLATVVLVGLTFAVFSSYSFSPGALPVGRLGGLMERLLFTEILAWYVVIGSRLWRGQAWR